MKAKRVFETIEKSFGPIVSILMIVDFGKDIYEYINQKVQSRKAWTALTPALCTRMD